MEFSNVAGYDWTLGPAHNADIRFEKPRNRNSQALNRETDSIRLWKILEGLDVVAALAGQMFPVLDGDFTYAAWWTAAVCGLFWDETCTVKDGRTTVKTTILVCVCVCIYIYPCVCVLRWVMIGVGCLEHSGFPWFSQKSWEIWQHKNPCGLAEMGCRHRPRWKIFCSSWAHWLGSHFCRDGWRHEKLEDHALQTRLNDP